MNSPLSFVRSPGLTFRCVVFAVIGALFVDVQIQQSLDQGVLAFPITYDDSTYYWEGLQRLHRAYDVGLRTLITDFVSRPPHSAWSTAIAFAGFAVFGPADWAPIAANGVVVAAAAIALAVATQSLPLFGALAILVAALTWPFTTHLAMESRPDVVWGLALAGFAAVISRLALGELSRKWWVAGVLLLALAFLSKLTTVPVTLAVTFTISFVVMLLRRSTLSMTWSESARPLLSIVFVGFLVCTPVFAVSFVTVAKYVYENVFGQRAATWELPLSALDHALYHLSGVGGRTMMAGWLTLWALTFVGSAALVFKRDDKRAMRVAIAFASAFLVGFLAVTLPAHKSPHIGAVVPAFFLVSWIAMTVYLVRHPNSTGHEQQRWHVAVLWIFPLVGLLLFQWHATSRFGPNTPERSRDAADRHATIQRMLSDLEASGVIQGTAYFVGSAPYLNATTLNYYAAKRRRPAPEFSDDIFSSDLKLLDSRIRDSAAVISFPDGNEDVSRWLPSGKPPLQVHAAQTLETLADDAFVFHYPSLGGGEARMHVRRGAFHGVKPDFGLGALEGPYPQWNLPIVRWGFGPESRISAHGSAGLKSRLRIEAQSPFADQVINVVVDGRKAGELIFTKKDAPETFDVALGELVASSTITLQYRRWTEPSAGDPRKMAVLFRRMQLF